MVNANRCCFGGLFLLLALVSGHKEHKHQKGEKLGDLFGIADMIEHFASMLSNDTLNQKLTDKGKPKDQQFYEFQLIDINKDNRLDGLEIMQFWIQEHSDSKEKISMEEFEELTDDSLADYDVNFDGYVNFKEFLDGAKRHGELS